jgi:ribose-phosphate pyrophosphokinase
MEGPLKVFAGTAHTDFARSVASCLGVSLGDVAVRRPDDGETYVTFNESVRGCDCYIIQPTSPPVDTNIMELLILIDALRRASAKRITAVIPYYGYARHEKKTRPREPITAKLVANMLGWAGATRVMVMDVHSDGVQGFFTIPVDHLTGVELLIDYFRPMTNRDLVLVSPDEGGVRKLRKVSTALDKPLAVGYKYKAMGQISDVIQLVGDVKGKIPVIVEDMIATGDKIRQCVDGLLAAGCVPEIYIAATHGVLGGPAIERLRRPEIAKVVITDTVPLTPEKRLDKIEVLTVAPLFAEAIRRQHCHESISSLFDD